MATDREALGAEIAAQRGLTLVRPYDHPQVIAGQGTVGLELAAQAEAAGVAEGDVLVCCGGGGSAAGWRWRWRPRRRTAGAHGRAGGFDDMARSLAAGERLGNAAATGSICDAILTPRPGGMTFPVLQRLAGPGFAVSDEEALKAMALAFRHLRVVLGAGRRGLAGGGAVPRRRDRGRRGDLRCLRRQRRGRAFRRGDPAQG